MSVHVVDTSDRALPELLEELLEQGGVFIFPTDTVPGIGGDPWDRRPLARVRRLKGRSEEQPFTLHLATVAAVERVALLAPQTRATLARFLPGPYTFLLNAGQGAPPATVGEHKVGIRVPRHAFFAEVMRDLVRPLFGTSVNRAGEEPLLDWDEILERFPGVDLIVTGEGGSGTASAVVDLTVDPPCARRGSLPQDL